MTADSLIEKLEACKCGPEGKTHYEIVHDAAFNRAIDIVRAHQTEPPRLMNPEEIASCTVLKMHAGRTEAPQTQTLSVDQIAEAIFNTIHFSHWHCVYKDAVPLAARAPRMKGLIRALDESKRAAERIAAMSLRSADLSDAKGQEEAGRPAKEFGVEVPGAAPDQLIEILEGMQRYKSISGDWIRLKETVSAVRQYETQRRLPAWSEDGYKAACADMAAQIESAKVGGNGIALLAANVCVSSLCVAYKDAAVEQGQ